MEYTIYASEIIDLIVKNPNKFNEDELFLHFRDKLCAQLHALIKILISDGYLIKNNYDRLHHFSYQDDYKKPSFNGLCFIEEDGTIRKAKISDFTKLIDVLDHD